MGITAIQHNREVTSVTRAITLLNVLCYFACEKLRTFVAIILIFAE